MPQNWREPVPACGANPGKFAIRHPNCGFQMRRPNLFKERDVTRATKAVLAAGLNVARVEINRDGLIVVVPGNPEEPTATDAELDNWMKKHHADSA